MAFFTVDHTYSQFCIEVETLQCLEEKLPETSKRLLAETKQGVAAAGEVWVANVHPERVVVRHCV